MHDVTPMMSALKKELRVYLFARFNEICESLCPGRLLITGQHHVELLLANRLRCRKPQQSPRPLV
jgi:hypothetical protein